MSSTTTSKGVTSALVVLGLDHGSLSERTGRLEALILARGLEETAGNKSSLARELGLSRAGLNMKLKRHGLWLSRES